MKHTIAIFISLILNFSAIAEDFYIENFHVKIEILPDGSMEITEKINVNFTAARRGILRTIPFQYHISYLPDSLKSFRAEPTSSYFIKIYDLSVENRQFATTENYNNLEIKIGSPNKLVNGKQEYIIHYKVSGIVNPFSLYDEITWNIIGNEWNVPINKVNFEIHLKKAYALKKSDIQIVTGEKGQQNHDAIYTLNPSQLIGESTKILNPNEGISIALKFQKKYLQTAYKIEKIKSFVKINHNGSCNFVDSIEVNFNNFQNGFIYEIPKFITIENGKQQEIFLKFNTQKNKFKVTIKEKGDFYQFHIGSASNSPMLNGKQIIELQYQTWGSLYKQKNKNFFAWNFFTQSNENYPFDAHFSIKTDKSVNLEQSKNLKNSKTKLIASKNKIDANFLKTNKPEEILLQLPENTIGNLPDSEIIKSATNYYIDNINVNIKIDNDKLIHFNEKIEINFFENYKKKQPFPLVYNLYRKIYYFDFQHFESRTIRTNRQSFFSDVYKPYYSNIEFSPNTFVNNFASEQQYTWYSELENQNNATMNIKYSVYDITTSTDSGIIVHIPILTNTCEPIKETFCSIELPKPIENEQINCYITYNDSLSKKIPFSIEKNKISLKLGLINAAQTPFAIAIRFPESVFTNISVSSEINLFLINNSTLLIPVFVFFVLLIIWLLIGKEIETTLVVQYHAPENVTPAEAGLLWDNKLHKRDLIALFYYWAAKNYITIIDDGHEISFKLLKNLPKTAKNFEKTIFNSIFYGKKETEIVQLSQFKGKFASKLQKAFKQMVRHAKTNNFYTPGTYGFGQFLVALSIVTLISSGIVFLNEFRFNQLFISLLSSSIIVFFFGKIMPKRAHFGNKIYKHLIGFAEFIEIAEKERLETLISKNENYFSETIAFAIIMGKGKIWSEKFNELTINKPIDYGKNNLPLSTSEFAKKTLNTMHKIEQVLNYNSSNSWKRSTWNNSSRASWSGGSSFRSSTSFRSGGGFGGGGGSSW